MRRCIFGIDLNVFLPLLRHIVFVKDGFDWAFRDAGFAVDALVWVDVEHLVAFVEALDRTNDDAVRVFAVKTWLRYDVWHLVFSW
jgi:hypothetical protein